MNEWKGRGVAYCSRSCAVASPSTAMSEHGELAGAHNRFTIKTFIECKLVVQIRRCEFPACGHGGVPSHNITFKWVENFQNTGSILYFVKILITLNHLLWVQFHCNIPMYGGSPILLVVHEQSACQKRLVGLWKQWPTVQRCLLDIIQLL
jgi:hypothetical protein